MQISPIFFNWCFYSLEKLIFYLESQQGLFLGLYCPKVKNEKLQIFDQINGLTPLEKCRFCDFHKPLFL